MFRRIRSTSTKSSTSRSDCSRPFSSTRKLFGADKLVVNPMPRGGESSDTSAGTGLVEQFLKDAPFSDQAKQDYRRLIGEPQDYSTRPDVRREKSQAGADELCQLPD